MIGWSKSSDALFWILAKLTPVNSWVEKQNLKLFNCTSCKPLFCVFILWAPCIQFIKLDTTLKYFKTEKRICSLIKFKTDSIIIQAIDGISKLIGWWLTKLGFDRCLPGFCNTMHDLTTKNMCWNGPGLFHYTYSMLMIHVIYRFRWLIFSVKWVGIWWNRNINTAKTHRKKSNAPSG